jgi:glycosyltransferase involved in cell wall biosynthesis
LYFPLAYRFSTFLNGAMGYNKTFVFVNSKPDLQSGGNIYNANIIACLRSAGYSVFETKDVYAKEFTGKNYTLILDSIILDSEYNLSVLENENVYFLIHLWPTHNTDFPKAEKEILLQKQIELCAKYPLIFAGEHALRQCLAFYAEPLKKQVVIPPGVTSNWQRKTEYNATAKQFLLMGNFCKRKRQLEVAQWFANTNLPVELTLVGRSDGSLYSNKIEVLVGGNPTKIKWKKELLHSHINSFLLDFDTLILFSEEENNSMAILESIASGLPFVTTPTGNFLAFKQHKVGVVLDDFRLSSLEKAILNLHNSPDFYKQQYENITHYKVNSWAESSEIFAQL